MMRTKAWMFTPEGEPRGYIDPHALRELWFHTGTRCNLSCGFCLEGSSPGDKRLQTPTLAEVVPYIDEALTLGVEQFSFTGGEPFLVKEIIAMLDYASRHRPCLVLTNATEPLLKRLPALVALRHNAHPISLRVSLDYPQAAQHDAGRGAGNFAKAVAGLKRLHEAGFAVSVARQQRPDEDRGQVEQAFRMLFARHDLPESLPLVAFPDFLPPGASPAVPQITTRCMTTYQDDAGRRNFMCAFSKMVIKRQGQMQVYACTLVDDDPDYCLGSTLRESLEQRISMKHHRCYSCFAYGASCSEISR